MRLLLLLSICIDLEAVLKLGIDPIVLDASSSESQPDEVSVVAIHDQVTHDHYVFQSVVMPHYDKVLNLVLVGLVSSSVRRGCIDLVVMSLDHYVLDVS